MSGFNYATLEFKDNFLCYKKMFYSNLFNSDLKSLKTCQSTKESTGLKLTRKHAGSKLIIEHAGSQANTLVLSEICRYNPIP